MQRWMTVDVTQKYSLDQGTGSKMAVREGFWPLRRSDVTAPSSGFNRKLFFDALLLAVRNRIFG